MIGIRGMGSVYLFLRIEREREMGTQHDIDTLSKDIDITDIHLYISFNPLLKMNGWRKASNVAYAVRAVLEFGIALLREIACVGIPTFGISSLIFVFNCQCEAFLSVEVFVRFWSHFYRFVPFCPLLKGQWPS